MTPFDRLEITVFGELMYARPIDFIYDGNGDPVKAIKWEAVNPNDGQMLQFTEDNIMDNGGKLTYSEVYVNKSIEQFDKIDPVIGVCPFQDPIELGLIFTDVAEKADKKEVVDDSDCPFQDPVAIGLV